LDAVDQLVGDDGKEHLINSLSNDIFAHLSMGVYHCNVSSYLEHTSNGLDDDDDGNASSSNKNNNNMIMGLDELRSKINDLSRETVEGHNMKQQQQLEPRDVFTFTTFGGLVKYNVDKNETEILAKAFMGCLQENLKVWYM